MSQTLPHTPLPADRVRKILEPMGAHRRSLDQYPALAPHPKVAT